MEKFIIEGGKKLEGEIDVQGSKNGAAAVLAACLLTKEECVIDNLPLVCDVLNLLQLMEQMGSVVQWLDKRTVKIKAENLHADKIDFVKFSQSRTSVLLIGALVNRFSYFKVSRPGGDRIGLRPISTHLQALKNLGIEVKTEGDFYFFEVKNLKGQEIILPEFSVTATEILIMAAVLAQGTTIIKIAAGEPHIQDLVLMLNKMGASIQWQGSHTLIINGVKELGGTQHRVIADAIEAGTFMVMGILCGGKVIVKNVEGDYLDLFYEKLTEMGVSYQKNNNTVMVQGCSDFAPVKIQALPYPGFPTDLLPLMAPLLTQAKGKSLLHDPLYENRFNYIHQLRKMGADIEMVDPHRVFVFGPTALFGVSIESWDIRAGASLLAAALFAKGKTQISNIEQIDRGYEKIEERLQKLGAEIKRIAN